MTKKIVTAHDIFMFVPNLIGYGRIVLAIVAFYFIKTNYIIAAACYILSGFLDAFDGHAARLLNQGTKFGAMLDQLTDRAATACLCVALATFYPQYMFWFQMSLALDIVSHWMHLHVSQLGGTSHKSIGLEGNPIMRLYYTSRPVLFVMCSGNELFFAMLYLLHFTEGPLIEFAGLNLGLVRLVLYLSTPIMIGKAVISLIHLVDASRRLAEVDAEERSKAE
uniref:CDP-diacylglycerol--inositol 3-phosphatidyltransferase-like n=1 Tax=Styela clava TaxID=7725 RepID=UPI00193ABC0C|nr:CDP-diacylglycerol--inositol 3-phosphatidyltransferase-like [Styela clava]